MAKYRNIDTSCHPIMYEEVQNVSVNILLTSYNNAWNEKNKIKSENQK